MGLFCELFDMAWMGAEERAAAKTILMLRALDRAPCELSAAHAITSDLIIEDCAEDHYFQKLVAAGRIRFRRRHNGRSAREAVADALRDKTYRMDNWSGIWPDAESADEKAADERRDAAVAVIERRAKLTKHEALDNRLSKVEVLLAAIEAAGYAEQELPHGDEFASYLRDAGSYIDPNYAEVKQLLGRVVTKLDSRRVRLDRSTVYTAIEEDQDGAVELEPIAKGIVDSFKSRAVASSLGETLLSVDRKGLLRGGYREESQAKATTAKVERVAETVGEGLDALALEWKDVHAAASLLTGTTPHEWDLKIARDKLVDIILEKRIAAPSKYISAVTSKGGSTAIGAAGGTATTAWVVTSLSGALGATSVAILGGVVGLAGAVGMVRVAQYASEVAKKRYKANTERNVDFWLDLHASARE